MDKTYGYEGRNGKKEVYGTKAEESVQRFAAIKSSFIEDGSSVKGDDCNGYIGLISPYIRSLISANKFQKTHYSSHTFAAPASQSNWQG